MEIKKLKVGDKVTLLPEAENCDTCVLNRGFYAEVVKKNLTGIIYAVDEVQYYALFAGATRGNNPQGDQAFCHRHGVLKQTLFDTEPFKSMREKYGRNLFGEHGRTPGTAPSSPGHDYRAAEAEDKETDTQIAPTAVKRTNGAFESIFLSEGI